MNSSALAIRWPPAGDLTFEQLTHHVNEIRQQLLAQKIRSGDICLLAIPTSPHAIVAILALMAEGAIPMLPPADMTLKQGRKIRRQHQIQAIITNQHPSLRVRLLGLFFRIRLINATAQATRSAVSQPIEVAGPPVALITFSSGSTGQPKAIERSHDVLIAQHRAILRVFPKRATPLDFPLFPNVLLHNLATGIGTVMPHIPDFRLDQLVPKEIITQIQQEGVRTLTGNVFYFTRLLDHAASQSIELSQVEAVGVGGSPVPELLLERVQKLFRSAKIYVIYGSSEAEPIAVREFTEPKDPLLGYAVGPIHPGLEWKLASGSPLAPEDGRGELLVKGPHVVVPAGEEWFATGDIGYVRDRELFLTARRGNEAVIGGKQHYQLEHYLQHQKGIEKAAALANERFFDIIFEGTLAEAAVRAALNQVIAPDCINTIRRVETLPMDRRHYSKILYRELKK